ncbi:ATP-binding protein [Fodinicola acaciae]|uniref:ATP-binding protein n=1 Tax=Fodinicola acaciae TaxID=2681555 RepID=UPI0013D24AD4|nr:SbcC/MukB-like Walker B domain-containing protein [Fodinicola acaciae]
MVGDARGQFRIDTVQILNWGGYAGLQVMHVGRAGTAILGPSGRGKSQLLDAMASVIMPNPQEFNQAARDDKGKKRERTVYSYARGKTDQRRDENKRSGTASYKRPPGGRGFASGAAITWADEAGRRVTALRLAWVGPDTIGADAIAASTVYGFVHGFFDLTRLNGLSSVRAGAPPISKATLGGLIDAARGDIIDPSQSRIHAKMRTVMHMGHTDESQQLAMDLLRRAHASKGIFNINTLFKEFVLTEPLALTRWDTALDAYREASRLYHEFEYARQRLSTLTRLPDLAEKYRTAGNDYVAKQHLLDLPATDQPSRLAIWHAEKLYEWADHEIDTNRLDRAELDEQLQEAKRDDNTAQNRFDDILNRLTAAGGDPTQTLTVQLEREKKDLDALEKHREALARRLEEFEMRLPTSQGDLTLLHESMKHVRNGLENEKHDLDQSAYDKQAEFVNLKRRIQTLAGEIEQLKQRRSNIPPSADAVRTRIARDTGVPTDRLSYAGELIQVKPEHRRWEPAVLSVLGGLASDLLVAERDLPAVRRYVNDHDMGERITLVGVPDTRRGARPIDNTIPALLDIAESPYADWLSKELIEHFSYWCVERDSELQSHRPAATIGAVTRAGMRTGARGRFIKNDRRSPYKWIGWDNQQLRAELADQIASLMRERPSLESKAEAATDARDVCRDRIKRLTNLGEEITWSSIDTTPLEERVHELEEELARADTPQARQLREQLEQARTNAGKTSAAAASLEERQKDLDRLWERLIEIQDTATTLVDSQPPLDDDERGALASLPFKVPTSPDHTAVNASRRGAEVDLGGQIEQHRKDREAHEQSVLATIQAYRNIDDRTEREIDGTIDSLPALLAIHQQLLDDDLPRAKQKWLQKVDQDMNRQLNAVLVQIEEDGRQIRHGLKPINTVLKGVSFREGSTLAIDSSDRPNSDHKDFRDIISRYTSNTVAQDPARDAEQIEKSFVRLHRSLERLDDLSRTGEAWRRRVFDAREQVEFRAIETKTDGTELIHEGVSGMSGGEGQELIAFILGAALRYRLGEGDDGPPTYASILLDEGFVKADSDYTGRSLAALRALGFQLIVAAPREKATAFEDYVETVAYINSDPDDRDSVRIFPMTIEEALQLDDERAS